MTTTTDSGLQCEDIIVGKSKETTGTGGVIPDNATMIFEAKLIEVSE